jgi:hypothetical protein
MPLWDGARARRSIEVPMLPAEYAAALALRDEQRPADDQSRSETLTGIIGARRAWTVSMISPLSMPWR